MVDGNYLWEGDLIDCGEGYQCNWNTCKCIPIDSDGDGVPDSEDVCPGYDDSNDYDGDGIPDACDETPIDCMAHCTGSGWIEGAYVVKGTCSAPDIQPEPCHYVCRYAHSLSWSWSGLECCCQHYYIGECPPVDQGCECPSTEELKNVVCPGHKPETPPPAP